LRVKQEETREMQTFTTSPDDPAIALGVALVDAPLITGQVAAAWELLARGGEFV